MIINLLQWLSNRVECDYSLRITLVYDYQRHARALWANPHTNLTFMLVHLLYMLISTSEQTAKPLFIIHPRDATGYPLGTGSSWPLFLYYYFLSISSGLCFIQYVQACHSRTRLLESPRAASVQLPSATVVSLFSQGQTNHRRAYSLLRPKNSPWLVWSLIVPHLTNTRPWKITHTSDGWLNSATV